MLKSKIKYKFDFGNIFKLFISYIIEILENIGMIFLTWIVIFSIGNLTLEGLPDCFAKEFFLKICFAITIILDLFFIVLIFIPKRVMLTDDKILVHRFCFQLKSTFWDIRGLNDRIAYSEIICCQKHVGEIYYGASIPFFCVNNDSLVEIRTKHKSYMLPIKEYESFIFEVNQRISENTDSNGAKIG